MWGLGLTVSYKAIVSLSTLIKYGEAIIKREYAWNLLFIFSISDYNNVITDVLNTIATIADRMFYFR